MTGIAARGLLRRPAALAVGALAVGALAAVAVGIVVEPLGPVTIDPDAAASVLYAERIAGGHRLEAFVPTTPKPLLTAAFGLVHALVGDWRALTWVTLAVFAVAAACAALFAWRTIRPGPIVAAACGAAFVTVALASSSDLVLEVSRANSLVWALAGWLVAGLAMMGARRRPIVAGVALLWAGLARVETLLVVAGIAGTFALVVVRGWRRPADPGSSGWRVASLRGRDGVAGDLLIVVVLGALAVPIACLHDLLLTADPWYWTTVPARYTELYVPSALPVEPLAYLGTLAGRFLPGWPLLVLAACGAVWLVASRRWVAVVGLGSLGLGSVLLLTVLAARGTYISARYYEPIDLVLLFLAGAAPAALLAVGSRIRGPAGRAAASSAAGVAVGALVGVVLGVAVRWPAAPFDRSVASSLALARASSLALEAYEGRLAELAGPAVMQAEAAPGAPLADPGAVTLFVPSLLRPRIAVDTGRPLTAIGDTYATFLASPAWDGLRSGQRIYHDRAADRPEALDRALEADPAMLGGATARPELVDDALGVRILLVESP